MIKPLFPAILCIIASCVPALSQIPSATLVSIVAAEDARNYDSMLEGLMKSANPGIRARAALAAGRIGDDAALPALLTLLRDKTPQVAVAAAFAIGEVESVKDAEKIISMLAEDISPQLRAKLIEAAGKIAGANPSQPVSKELGAAIVTTLKEEREKDRAGDPAIVRAGLTALLRARPAGALEAAALFLNAGPAAVRADASNTYARLRGTGANTTLRAVFVSDPDPVVRANAARALGVGGDVDFAKQLLEAAIGDSDSRVRVSAIRSLATLNSKESASALISRGQELLTAAKKSKLRSADEKSELLEIATVLGRLMAFTYDERTVRFLSDLRTFDKLASSETEISLARVAPNDYLAAFKKVMTADFTPADKDVPAVMQGFAEIARLPEEQAGNAKKEVRIFLAQLIGLWAMERGAHPDEKDFPSSGELVNAFAEFKSPNTSEILRPFLSAEEDVRTRAALASVLGKQPPSKENFDVVKAAFEFSLKNDKKSDDAVLASMEALFSIDKKAAVEPLMLALKSSNLIVRRSAMQFLKDPELKELLKTDFKDVLKVTKWPGGTVAKLGQTTLAASDYRRAISRRNGTVKAVFTTEKGSFTIDLLPEDAPLTVDNFITLARRNYFNGLTVHRVVPNFVMQDGDPDGTGSGGPGWNIRCEVNMVPYERGAVGMALSGKDTGGSQWFVTHSPQPHLDGGYTVFGRVSEKDMKVVDRIVRGDRIVRVVIVGR